MKGRDSHISYHEDGRVWNTSNRVTRMISRFYPLNSFKGNYRLVDFGFSKDMDIDARLYGDIQNIGCAIHLLEPMRYNMLYGFACGAEFHALH